MSIDHASYNKNLDIMVIIMKLNKHNTISRSNKIGIFLAAEIIAPFVLFFISWKIGGVVDNFPRIFLLLLLIYSIVIMGVNYFWIFKPLSQLESMMIKWQRTSKFPTVPFYGKGALDRLFSELVEEQMKSVDREYKTEVLRQQAELMSLQSQINPHFLYNTLDSIRGFAIKNDVPQIANMTEALSKLFRRMIAKDGMMITLAEEFQSVDNYMVIQQFRFANKFEYKTDVSDSSLLCLQVPNLIIQPIVENAIIHGLEKKETKGHIDIYAYATQNRLVITVGDDGVGVLPERLASINSLLLGDDLPNMKEEKVGIALRNINQRIKLRFGDNYGINLMSTQGISTTVEIILPLIREEVSHASIS